MWTIMCVVLQKYAVHLTSCDVDCEDRGSYDTCLKKKERSGFKFVGKSTETKKFVCLMLLFMKGG